MPLLSTKLRYLLFPLALFYWGTIFWRNLFYTIGFFVTRRLPVPVVSVGNLSFGGTGKTSLVTYLAEKLHSRGVQVVILSRGYRRKSSGTKLVSDRKSVLVPWEEAGDEPYFMAKALPGIPVVVDEVRYRGGLFAIEKFNPDMIILDDAFQHRAVDRDVDIVLLNSYDPPEAYKLLPYGKLREPWIHLKRADLIFWTKVNLSRPHPALRSKVLHANVPMFTSRAEPDHFLRGLDGSTPSIEKVVGKKVVAFCGIGDPDSFCQLLREIGAEVTHFKAFEDHHVYSEAEVSSLIEIGQNSGVDFFLTTNKDIFKVARWVPENVLVYSVGIQFVPSKKGHEVLMKMCLESLRRRPRD